MTEEIELECQSTKLKNKKHRMSSRHLNLKRILTFEVIALLTTIGVTTGIFFAILEHLKSDCKTYNTSNNVIKDCKNLIKFYSMNENQLVLTLKKDRFGNLSTLLSLVFDFEQFCKHFQHNDFCFQIIKNLLNICINKNNELESTSFISGNYTVKLNQQDTIHLYYYMKANHGKAF